MSAIPIGYPTIPADVSANEVVAIVTIHHAEAVKANQHSRYPKTPLLTQRPGRVTRGSIMGCNVFLTRSDGNVMYSMGRGDSQRLCDVCLTDKQVSSIPRACDGPQRLATALCIDDRDHSQRRTDTVIIGASAR